MWAAFDDWREPLRSWVSQLNLSLRCNRGHDGIDLPGTDEKGNRVDALLSLADFDLDTLEDRSQRKPADLNAH